MPNRKYFPKDILKSDKSLKIRESNYAISNEIPVSTVHSPLESTNLKEEIRRV